MAKKYRVICFGRKDKSLMIAIADPGMLNNAFSNEIVGLISKKGFLLDIYITGQDDFLNIFKKYDKKSEGIVEKGSYPTVFLRNQYILNKFLAKLPLDFIVKHRAVIFYQKLDGTYALAAEKPDDPIILRAVSYLEKNNKIQVQIFATSKQDIDYAIELYKNKILRNNDEVPEVKIQELPKEEVLLAKKEMEKSAESQKSEEKRVDKNSENDEEIVKLGSVFNNIFGKSKTEKEGYLTIDEHSKNEQNDKDSTKKEADIKKIPIEEEKEESEKIETEKIEPEFSADQEKKEETESIEAKQEEDVIKEDNEEKGVEPVNEEAEKLLPNENVEKEESPSRETKTQIYNSEGDIDEDIGKLISNDIESVEALKKVILESYVPKTVAADRKSVV